MLLELQNLGKSFGEHEVLHDVTAGVERGDRIGIIGANGTGKTTLLRILCGESLPDAGDAAFGTGVTTGYLEQNARLDPALDVYATMKLVFTPALDAMQQMEGLQKQLAADPHNAELTDKIAHCTAVVDAMDAYNMDTQIKKVLNGMGFPADTWTKAAGVLSGGEQTRLRLARLLLERLPVGKKDVSAAHIEALLTLREGGMLDLPEGVTAWREKDVLHLEMTPPLPLPLTLSEGEQVWGDYLVRVWRSEKNTPPPDGEGLSKTGRFSDHILTLSDGGKMSEWTLRCPQRGDGLTLPGARGRRSVKRLLTERGMPPRRRRTTPVVCINGEPAAVYGVGTDQRFLPGKDGSSINILMIEKDQEEESNG